MKRTALIAAGLGIAAAASAPVAASALSAGAAAGGRVQVFETPSLIGGTSPVVITGAIGDYGKAMNVNKAGRPDASGTYSKLVLSRGTIIGNATTLDERVVAEEQLAHVNPSNCSLQFSFSAPVPLVSGTGAYSGITGTVKVKFTLAELGTTFASGPKQGQCNPNGSIAAAFSSAVGSGAVRFK